MRDRPGSLSMSPVKMPILMACGAAAAVISASAAGLMSAAAQASPGGSYQQHSNLVSKSKESAAVSAPAALSMAMDRQTK
jgi:hypothetical protein